MKWSSIKITLKHNLGYLYSLSKPEPWPTLCTWKVHFDWTRILGLKRFFFSLKDFCNQRGCCLFFSTIILDKPFTCSGWIFKCIIGQSKNENGKKNDSRVKTRKGSLEQKLEKFRKLMGEANKRMKGNNRTASESSMRSFTLSKTKNLNSSFQNVFTQILESITVGLDTCQIAIFKN